MPPVNDVSGHQDLAPVALSAARFAHYLDRLGPFAPAPHLAAGVSGGADSLALAVLAEQWTRVRGGSLLALIVDHGLRPAAAADARLTAARLAGLNIPSRILTIQGLRAGPAQSARARAARLAALAQACIEADITDLLLGHHAADTAETLMIRALSASGADGLAGIAALRHLSRLRLLRPLLSAAPESLRATLQSRGIAWLDDPSNADPAALRARLRGVIPAAVTDLAAAAAVAAEARGVREAATAEWLAAHAVIRPEGFVVIPAAPLPAAALAALVQMVGGRAYPPAGAAVRALAAAPRPATIGGTRLLAAGRWGPGLLIVREASAIAEACSATADVRWDSRFRLAESPPHPACSIGAIGAAAAARLRHRSRLPGIVLAGLPALWCRDILVGLPQLIHRDGMQGVPVRFVFDPPRPAACCPFAGA